MTKCCANCLNCDLRRGERCANNSCSCHSPTNTTEEEVKKNKTTWEVYGPLGMGIDYLKLTNFVLKKIEQSRIQGMEQAEADSLKVLPELLEVAKRAERQLLRGKVEGLMSKKIYNYVSAEGIFNDILEILKD